MNERCPKCGRQPSPPVTTNPQEDDFYERIEQECEEPGRADKPTFTDAEMEEAQNEFKRMVAKIEVAKSYLDRIEVNNAARCRPNKFIEKLCTEARKRLEAE